MTRCPSCFEPTERAGPCTSCAARARSKSVLALGTTLADGRYSIGRTLGEPGGFGVTYLGWDASLERKVAIKEYFPQQLANRSADNPTPSPTSELAAEGFASGLKGFLDEARRLAKLDHQNIVKVHDYCEAHGTGYLVMAYYQGRDLREHAQSNGDRLDWQEAVKIALPLLDGLAEVHQAGLIHRDIKPANIYLATLADGSTRPILIDFGAARWATTSHELTAVLTEGFAPLEQYPGCGPQGPYTDVYAAAATIYSVISGLLPASAPSRLSAAYVSHLTDQVPGVPRRLGDALEQGMAIMVEDRPQSAGEFARALRNAISSTAPSLSGERTAPRFPRPDISTAPTQHIPATVRREEEAPAAPRPSQGTRIAAIVAGIAVVGVLIALMMNKSSAPPATGAPTAAAPAASPATTAAGRAAGPSRDETTTESQAERNFRAAATAMDGGDYAAAMKATTALHLLAAHRGVAVATATRWNRSADSVAAHVIATCAFEREADLKRGVAAPACPARGW